MTDKSGRSNTVAETKVNTTEVIQRLTSRWACTKVSDPGADSSSRRRSIHSPITLCCDSMQLEIGASSVRPA